MRFCLGFLLLVLVSSCASVSKTQQQVATEAISADDRVALTSLCTGGNVTACEAQKDLEELSNDAIALDDRLQKAIALCELENIKACEFKTVFQAYREADAPLLAKLCDKGEFALACNMIRSFENKCNERDGASCAWVAHVTQARLANQPGNPQYRRYLILACNYSNKDACNELEDLSRAEAQELEAKRALAAQAIVEARQEAEAARLQYLQSTAGILDSWMGLPIEQYIESYGAPSRIISIGSDKKIYEFEDSRGAVNLSGITLPIKCKLELYVRKGKMYMWRTYGNAGMCRH